MPAAIFRYSSAAAIGVVTGFVCMFLYFLRILVGCAAEFSPTGAPLPGSPAHLFSLLGYAIACSPSAALYALNAGAIYCWELVSIPLLLYLWDVSPKEFEPLEKKPIYSWAPRVFIGGVIILLLLEELCSVAPATICRTKDVNSFQFFRFVCNTFAILSLGTYFPILILPKLERLINQSSSFWFVRLGCCAMSGLFVLQTVLCFYRFLSTMIGTYILRAGGAEHSVGERLQLLFDVSVGAFAPVLKDILICLPGFVIFTTVIAFLPGSLIEISQSLRDMRGRDNKKNLINDNMKLRIRK